MADYAVRRIDEMEAIVRGSFKKARAELGVSSFGIQVIDMPPNVDAYPEHDHSQDGQEEVYVAMRGGGEIEIDGERHPIDPETMVRVSAGTKRKLYPGDEGMRVLVIGGVPGEAYAIRDYTELGAPDPFARSSRALHRVDEPHLAVEEEPDRHEHQRRRRRERHCHVDERARRPGSTRAVALVAGADEPCRPASPCAWPPAAALVEVVHPIEQPGRGRHGEWNAPEGGEQESLRRAGQLTCQPQPTERDPDPQGGTAQHDRDGEQPGYGVRQGPTIVV